MRGCILVSACALAALAALAAAVPVPEARPETLQDMQAQLPPEVQERLSALQLDEQALAQVTRDKRTIAVLRQLFPGISQLIDRKIQQITQYLFRTIGRLVLRGGLGGGGGGAAAGAAGGTGNRRISITLPTFPPDSEEEEDEEEGETAATAETATEAGTEGSPTELNPEENQLAGAESQVSEVRSQYADQDGFGYDQDAAASGGNDVPDPANAETADEEEADRNKRQFQIGGSAGSGGGSGNFLFDIIRLVSGGSGSGGASEASTDGASAGVEKDDGYGAGIPGPVTRLFIIANRGIANLVQDLILRIAQTSERLVNFKARLITSII